MDSNHTLYKFKLMGNYSKKDWIIERLLLNV